MKNTRFGIVFLLLGAGGACGGNPLLVGKAPPVSEGSKDSGVPVASLVGSVDLSQAPAGLEMTCDRDVGSLALRMPCEIGQNIQGQSRDELGFNEVDCHVTASGQPMVWPFLLVFSQILQHPDQLVTFPSDAQASPDHSVEFLPPPSGSTRPIDVGGEPFNVSSAEGIISFSRIDSPGRAFSGRLKGRFDWTSAAGSTFSCQVDGPFWGGPGNFL